MKKIFLLVAALMAMCCVEAQESVKMLRVNQNGQILFQIPVSNMDSIKTNERIATFYYGGGEATWSHNMLMIDSITVNNVTNGDTNTYVDTTAIDTSSHVIIVWNGSSASVTNPYASSGVTVDATTANVTVTAQAGINNIIYEMKGSSTDGSLVLNTDSKTIIMLNGLQLTSASSTTPAINLPDKKNCILHLTEGTVNTISDGAANAGKSAIYNKGAFTLQGGGSLVVNSQAVNGLQGKNGVTINGGDITINVVADKSKGIKSDEAITINSGVVNITAAGSVVIDTLTDGTYDMSYCTGIGTDVAFNQHGGTLTVNIPTSNAGGRGISSNGHINIDGGYITITTAGNGSAVGGTGTSAQDGYACCGIKADSNITILGGHINVTSTGRGGRGIACDGNYTQGLMGADNDNLHVHITTSGSPANTTSGGGGWGGPGGGSSVDYWKGLPKGLKAEGSIYIYSGHLTSYCSQTSGDPNGEAIETKDSLIVYGGDIEANSYDDAINCGTYMEVNGGRIWAYARGNDGIDNNGSYTVINGGLIIARGTEVAFDASTDAGGHFIINGGTMICLGGNMGAWDQPTMQGTQRYLRLNNDGSNGLVVKNSNGEEILNFKNNSVNGSGFIDESTGTGTKPPPGGGGGGSYSSVTFTSPDVTAGTYTIYTSATINGGTSWHGFYTGSTSTTSGNGTSATAQQ